MKKVLAVLISVALMSVMFFSGCSTTSQQSPESESTQEIKEQQTKITDGYYFYQGEQTGGLLCFFHFSEDGTYYGKFFEGGIVEAGTYIVVDKAMDYIADFGADNDVSTAEDNTVATAQQVVQLTNYETKQTQEIAFDNDKLCDATLGGMSNHITLEHKADYVYNPETEELSIAVATYYLGEDTGSSLTLYHNKQFADYTGEGEDGVWEQTANGYTLTTSATNKQYTLEISADGKTAIYTKGEESLELNSGTTEESVVYTFEGTTTPAELPMEVAVAIVCKSENVAQVVVSHEAFGEVVVDEGTYQITNGAFISFDLQKGGIIEGETDLATATEAGVDVAVAYKAKVVIAAMGQEVETNLECELKGQIVA